MEVVMNRRWMFAVLFYLFQSVTDGGETTLCADVDDNGIFRGDLCVQIFGSASFFVRFSGQIVDSHAYFSSEWCYKCSCNFQSMPSCPCPNIDTKSNSQNLYMKEWITPQTCADSSADDCGLSELSILYRFVKKLQIQAVLTNSTYGSILILSASTQDDDLNWSGQATCVKSQTNQLPTMTIEMPSSDADNSFTNKDLIIGVVVGVGCVLILIIIILVIVVVIILRRRQPNPSNRLASPTARNTILPNSSSHNGNPYLDLQAVVAPYESLDSTSMQPPPAYETIMKDNARTETAASAPSYDYDNVGGNGK